MTEISIEQGKQYHTHDGRIAEIVEIHFGEGPPQHIHRGNVEELADGQDKVPHIVIARLVEEGVTHDGHPMHVDKFLEWVIGEVEAEDEEAGTRG